MDDSEKRFYEELFQLLKSDMNAMEMCFDLIYCGHFWDDLIDKDKVRTDDEIDQCFTAMLGRLPRNPFFQRFIRDLAPLMMSTVLQWKDANKLEVSGNLSERNMAFMLRNMLMQVVGFCIWLVGGDEWYSEAGERFQRLCSKEIIPLYGEFMKEMGHA
jgi:hypothetical protein